MKLSKEQKAAKRFYKTWTSKASKRQSMASGVEIVRLSEVFKRKNIYVAENHVILAMSRGIHVYNRTTREMFFWANIVK